MYQDTKSLITGAVFDVLYKDAEHEQVQTYYDHEVLPEDLRNHLSLYGKYQPLKIEYNVVWVGEGYCHSFRFSKKV